MQTSFEEKTIWITLLAMLAVLSYYAVHAARLLSAGITNVMTYIPLFIGSVILLVVIMSVSMIIVRITAGPDGLDERDRLIAWRADGYTSWLFVTGILAAMVALVAPTDSIWVAHILFITLFGREVANCLVRLYYYRRGL